MIETMNRISCAVPESLGLEFFDFLQKDGRVQLILPEAPSETDKFLQRLEELREKLCAINEALDKVPVDGAASVELTQAERAEIDAVVASFADMLPELEESAQAFQDDLFRAKSGHEKLIEEKKLLDLILGQISSLAFKPSTGRQCLVWWVPEYIWPLAWREIEKNNSEETVLSHLHPTARDDQLLAELSVPVAAVPAVVETLRTISAQPWTPPRQYCGKNYSESMTLMKARVDEIDDALAAEKAALMRLKKQWGPRQEAFYLMIDNKVDQYRALARCPRVGAAVLVKGWLLADDLADFRARLKERFGGEIALYAREPEPDEYSSVPTKLKESKFFAPFALFLKLVQPPAYGSADPTALIGIFFSIFSGCIIGDAGYGLVMLILMLLLRKKSQNKIVRDIAFVLINVCVWSLFWGVMFGEFFGDTLHRLVGFHPLWVERSEAVMPVLMFAVGLGLTHVLLGLFVGLIMGVRGGHKKHAMEKLGGILVILAMVLALMGVRRMLPSGALPSGIALLVCGLILLCAGGGIGGLIESMSSFGHILSYVRIGAIGLSSAILAVAASKFVDVLGVSVLGIFIALAIHLLNFVLAFAESGLHSARLHYVEFMGNFYEAKGTEYCPFTVRRNLPWKKDS